MRVVGPRIKRGANQAVALVLREELQASDKELTKAGVLHSAPSLATELLVSLGLDLPCTTD